MLEEMAIDFRITELGEGVYEAELVAWHVKAGDAVKRGQNLMEVLTDKASMEVPAPFAGTITGLKAEPGQNIKVGEAVLTYTPAGSAGGSAAGEDSRQSAEKPPTAVPAMPVAKSGAQAKPLRGMLSRLL